MMKETFVQKYRVLIITLVVFALLILTKRAMAQDDMLAATNTPCSAQTKTGAACIIQIPQLRPTQFAVGQIAVDQKAKKLVQMGPSEYLEYILSHPIPIVVGNQGQFYMLDHHHLSRAVAQMKQVTLLAKVVQNWNDLSSDEFKSALIANQYVYLFDENGSPRDISELPLRIQDLKDDPYRSLSGEVEDKGGFIKGDVLYIEFIWAQFFRTRFTREAIQTEFKKTVKAAVALAHSPEAAEMPGYTPR